MPAIIAFVTTVIVPAIGLIFSYIAPVAGSMLGFTLLSIPKIPRYIKLLRMLYEDAEPGSKVRKYLTIALLILGAILTFMAFSFVPGTAIPIIGSFMTPIAAMLALVVSLATMDFIFNLNEGYYLKNQLKQNNPDEFASLIEDIATLSKLLGSSWEKLVKQIKLLFDKIEPELEKMSAENREAFDSLDKYFTLQLNGLLSYIGTQEIEPITQSELNKRIVTEGLEPWVKNGSSLVEGITAGTLTGVGTSSLASSIFVQASFWTSVQGFLGLSSGIAVGASAYALLTIVAPIGIGALATVGVYKGATHFRNEEEKRKMSSFIADVIIAALPMAWADGRFTIEEKDEMYKLLENPAISEKDRQRVYQEINSQNNFDNIVISGLLRDKNSQKQQLKRRMMLCVAWKIAVADGIICSEELKLHDRMANVLNIEQETAREIRRLITSESGILPESN